MGPSHLPWRDHAGRVAPLKAAVFIALFVPCLWIVVSYFAGWLAPRPLNEAIHQIGLWTIRILFIALAVTPLRQALQWPRLALLRRMIGVAAFAYAALHLVLYMGDQGFDLGKVAAEIVLRFYLTIGFVALFALALLAGTSTDGMIRRLGGRSWRRLHSLVYPLAALAVVHHFLQSKANVSEPLIMAGLYFWLMGYRLIARARADRRVPLWALGALGALAAIGTALGEAGYYHFRSGAPIELVLGANASLATGLRPSWVVGLAAGCVLVAALARAAPPVPRWRARTT
jgi:methionine sulfoxide reductase heme-binding subunit